MNYVEMTTSDNFFVRQDVTGFFKMLHGGRGGLAGWGGARGLWGVAGRGLAECGEARVCGGAGRGLAGWGGDSDPGAGWSGDSGPGAGWGLFGVRWEIFYLFAVFSPFG